MDNNVIEFSTIADSSYYKNNRILAMNIKEHTNITQGKCLDISSDGGQLGIAVAEITNLDIYLYDTSELSLTIAAKRIVSQKLNEKMFVLPYNAIKIPIDNDSVNLVVGTRSIWFVSNYVRSLNEIYRVLAPNGVAYIRIGNPCEGIKSVNNNIKHRDKSRIYNGIVTNKDKLIEQLIQAICKTNIKNFEVTSGIFGVWILVKKKLTM